MLVLFDMLNVSETLLFASLAEHVFITVYFSKQNLAGKT